MKNSMRYPSFLAATMALLLSACFGDAGKRPSPASYDFAAALAAPDSVPPSRLSLRQIEVQAPAWLESPAMQYILAYADPARREIYAESRWVAPPARLLEKALARRLLSGTSGIQSAGCRLRVELDEFAQVYDAPGSSRALVEARAMLLAPRGNVLLLRRSFRQSPATGADARAGVVAFTNATRDLGVEIDHWLNQMADEMPALIERCRNG